MSVLNFTIRPNKSIERKLISDCFLELSSCYSIKDYTYIGFGSFWFIDFLLFHKRLGINKMISIERSHYADRADFNKPLKCITVKGGDSTLILPKLDIANKTFLWMDYDKGISGPWKEDAEIALSKLLAGGIYITTINAHNGPVKNLPNDEGGVKSKLDALKSLVDDLVPPKTSESELNLKDFPKVVGKIMINHFRRVVRKANPSLKFEPILNFFYSDNAPMVTVGGMVVENDDESPLNLCNPNNLKFLSGENQYTIDAPPLTLKEKLSLDRLLPKARANIRIEEVPKKLRDGLSLEEIIGYQNFYRYYPVFAELQE